MIISATEIDRMSSVERKHDVVLNIQADNVKYTAGKNVKK